MVNTTGRIVFKDRKTKAKFFILSLVLMLGVVGGAALILKSMGF